MTELSDEDIQRELFRERLRRAGKSDLCLEIPDQYTFEDTIPYKLYWSTKKLFMADRKVVTKDDVWISGNLTPGRVIPERRP